MQTRICKQRRSQDPIFALSHCRDVVVAVTDAGGFGVLGALGYDAERVEVELDWIEDHVRGRPYGVDFAMPARYVALGGGEKGNLGRLLASIPDEHYSFVAATLDEASIPPLPADFERRPVKAADLSVDAEAVEQWIGNGNRLHQQMANEGS
jgi:hypothetical protein